MADLWIDGAARAGSGGRLTVTDPATGEPVDEVPEGGAADVDAAVASAAEAFRTWRRVDAAERAAHLRALADAVEAAGAELVGLLTREQGKPTLEGQGELRHFLGGLRYYAEAATKVRGSYQELPSQFGPAYGIVLRRPLGVVGAITPWNFPLTLLGNKVGPALAAGNTVVAKPAETTPLTTLAVARLAAEAGLPPGVLNVVTGGPATGEALVAHPGVRRLAFTGQTATGRRIMEVAGPALKHVSLELGGSDPTIVLADADLDAAVKNIQIGRYWNCGQACLAPKRAFVQAPVYDAFVELLASRVGRYEPGPGTTKAEKPRLRIGPLHTGAQRDLVAAQLRDAVDRGAKVVVGGEAVDGPGHFFQPAVVVDVPPDSRLATEEVFGPVLPVWPVEDLDEAIERANDSAYGLGSSIWTRDAVAIDRATRELEAGVTWVNQLHYGYDELPFGGTKHSGLGREHGLQALEEYTELKSVVVGGLSGWGNEHMAVTAEVKDRVGWITLDRPPANSYDAGFLEELDGAVGKVAEAEVAVAVVRSASEKFFSAGADVKAFLERSAEENMVMCRRAHQVLNRFAAESPLFVAAIAGHALGGGYEIALACDIRVAAEGSYRIGLPEVTLGLLPGTGGTQRLPRLIGRGRALELMTTGRTVTPAEAERLGMVDRLVPADEFGQAVADLAGGLAGGAPLAVAGITRAVNDGLDRPLEDALERELEELAVLFASEDAREGMTAFAEKRRPSFGGR